MPVRLKQPFLQQKAKRVIVSPSFRDPARIAAVDEFARAIDRIRRCIASGTPLPSGFYSKTAGRHADPMLASHGIMHLHLGRWNTVELLWLVQYPDDVVFLELSDHEPFRTRPIGVRLNAFHAAGLRAREVEIESRAASEAASREALHGPAVARVRAGLLARRPKRPGERS